MKADDQNMDEQFRKMAEETKFPYHSDFWKEVESQLADDSMDSAFRAAASSQVFVPSISVSDAIADAYLDEAFSMAAQNVRTDYQPSHWQEFLEKEAVLEQDVAFITAANSITADYHTAYWSDADQALQNEGLHYEYSSTYWDEARRLLDKEDRRIFFLRWSAVAAILLLLSVGTLFNSESSFEGNETNFADAKKVSVQHVSEDGSVHSNSPASIVSNDQLAQKRITEANNNHTESVDNGVIRQNNNGLNSEDRIEHQSTATSPETLVENREQSTGISPQLNPIRTDFSEEFGLNSNDAKVENLVQVDPLAEDMNGDLTFNFAKNEVDSESEVHTERPEAPLVEIEYKQPTASHRLAVVANGGFGNKYSKIDFIPSLRTSLGVEYMHTGYGKLRNIEFGASITMNHARQNDFGTERRVNVFNTDGGVDKFWYKLQLKDMIYTNVSGIASYKLDRRQNIRLSFGIDYLMFVQSNMSYQVDADQGITTVNNNWGVKEGLSKFDLRLGIGYEYSFSQRFSGQANASLGFFDRTDDQFIDKSFFDQEMSVTLGFKYTFLRKS